MRHHNIKCAWPYFQEVWDGRKVFEVRLNDRDYQQGDTIELIELDRGGVVTARSCVFRIGYVLREFPGLRKGWCAFSLLPEPVIEESARWRPEVVAFADLMERELCANDHKGGWRKCTPHELLRRLQEETLELVRELNSEREHPWEPWDPAAEPEKVKWRKAVRTVTAGGGGGFEIRPLAGVANRLQPTPEWRDLMAAEAADIANFAMMIVDVCGALAASSEGEAAEHG